MSAIAYTVKTSPTLKAPYDCVYSDSRSAFLTVLMNTLFNVHGLKCVTKQYSPPSYDVALAEHPVEEAESWRCIWKF